MNITHTLKEGRNLSAEVCDECGDVGSALLARLADRAEILADVETVEVELDWATLQLRAQSGQVRVVEPEFTKHPRTFTDSLVRTSRILHAQSRMLSALKIAGKPVTADQYVDISNDALKAVSVVGVRIAETDPVASGWKIVAATTTGNAETGLYQVRELAQLQPHWCAALALPPGWAFRFAGRTLIDCVSPQGETRQLLISIDY